MIKKYLLSFAVLFTLIGGKLNAQDVAVISITAPTSGCNLTAAENVVVRIFNYGPTDLSGVNIPVTYSVNGVAIPGETANFPSFLQNSTVTYTFTTQANLSTAGSYTIDATTSLGGDINTTNDAFTGYIVTNTAPSVGGTVTGGTNVCVSGNSGNLTLAGHTGNVLNWEYSTDGGSTWLNISNTTTTQSYTNLTIPTRYRANVQSGTCAAASSSTSIFTIDPATVAGTVNSSATICSGSSGNLTLTGKTGAVQYWEFSTDAGATWTNIANVTTSQAYSLVTATTSYRSNVKSGACVAINTNSVTLTVNPTSVGGTINPPATTVCSGSNSGTLTLSGHTGTVQRWESSTNGGVTWANIANVTATQNYTNLALTTQYRAQVKSGACVAVYSSTATVTVSPASVGGSVTANATVCSGVNSGTLTLAGHSGTILNWASSIDAGVTWVPIANTTTTQSYTNLVATTRYRASVQNGTCAIANSAVAIITVNAPSVGGTLASDATVCASANAGTITLAGHTGTIQRWESSSDNGLTWNNIANATTSQNYTNLSDTTLYRSLVKNGTCSSTYSDTVTITVDPITVAGTVSSSAAICSGLNNNTLNLIGNTGSVLNWEYSTDGGSTWVNVVNATTAQAYNNIATNTIYRALVKSGVCSSSYSGTATLTVDPQAVGGTTYGTATVCEGANSGAITLVGYSSSITAWETSTDGGTTWTPTAGTSAVLNYTNLLQSTSFHAITSSGVCPNDTSTVTLVSVDIPSVGGTVSTSDTVCAGANGAILNLSGNTGNVQSWEYSVDGGTSWILLSNTTTSQNYSNLTQSTYYRASVKNGVCAADLADSVYIKVDSAAIAGSISSPANLCISNANGTLTLAGYTGSIVDWQSSSDNGATWSGLTNTTNTHSYVGLTDTTYYKAIVTSGVCGNDTTSNVIIAVDQLTVGGTVSLSDTVCASGNGATLNITGSTGNVQGWEYSTNAGNSWIPMNNTTLSQAYANLTQTTYYRATLKSGVCPVAYADTAIIQVDAVPVAGSISSPATLCISNANGTLTLTGYTGSVLDWQSSSDNGATWSGLTNTTNTNNYAALTDTTYYKAIVTSGVCGNDTTSNVIITVDQLTVGGTVSLSDTVCASGNGATLNITGSTGDVQGWEYSSNGGNSWIPINNTTLSQAYTNLTQTTYYRATLKSGVCPIAYADTAIIQVDAVPVAGSISSPATLCISNANGTLTLAGYTGSVLDWQSSSDNGATWSGLTNTTNTNNYTALTDTTYYKAIVTSGVCGNDTTSNVIINVDQLTVGGTVSLSDTVCASGNGATLNITGSTGNVQGWEYSSNAGNSWIPINNTTLSQAYTNLTQTTYYRATLKNGVCPVAYADTAIIQVDAVPVAGSISSPATLCISNASGTLTLAGYTGSVVDWEQSIDNGTTWSGLTNTANILAYAALTTTTYFRTIVVSGVCGNDTSSNVIITIDPLTVGGTVDLSDTVCASGNGATLNITGSTGAVQGWEYSSNGGNSWIPLNNTTLSQAYTNLTQTTYYRATLKSGVCPAAYADTAIIQVDAVPVAGSISSPATLCISNASGTLTLAGYTGSIVDWQSSSDNGATWNGLTNTTNTNSYTSLTDTTYYKAIVTSGVCGNDTTSTTIIGVDQLSIGGTINSADTVCATANADTLALTGYTGTILGWEFSTNNGASWMTLTNSNDSLSYVDLSSSTSYHVIVKSGVCPAVYSATTKITVDAATNSGFITGGNTACQANNTGVLNLNGSVGTVLDWIFSTDNGASWISTTIDSTINYTYNNLGDTTWFKAIVKNGVCATDTSNSQTVYIYPNPIVSFTLDTVCYGDSTHFTSSISIPSGLIQHYTWNYGDGSSVNNTTQNHLYATADTFAVSLIAHSTFGCTDTAFASAIVKRSPSAIILNTLPLSFCPGDSTVLNFDLDSNATYTWSTLATDTFTVVDSSAMVVLTVTDTLNGCFAKDSVAVVQFHVDSISAGKDTTITLGSAFALQGYGTGNISWTPTGPLSNPLILDPDVTLSNDTTFILQITDVNTCINRDTVNVKIKYDYTFDVKNIITPNGDGLNDVWFIKNIESYPDNEVTVFNREGNIVYKTTAYKNDWEGTFNGKTLSDGAYFYMIKFEKSEKVLKGDINILSNK